MALRIRRGTNAQRTSVAPFDMGEIVWTTDTERLYVGDGITSGGKNILANSAGTGLVFNAVTQRLDVGNFNLTTDDVTEGTQPGRQYFTAERAQAAAASLLTTGAHTGISFTYQDVNNRIDAAVSLSLDSLTDVVITGTPTTGYVLKFDGTSWVPAPDTDTDTDTGILAVVEDTTPELGGNLVLNSYNISGTGNLNFTGNIDLIGDGTATGNITAPGNIEITGTLDAGTGLGANLNLNNNNIVGIGNVDVVGDLSGMVVSATEFTGPGDAICFSNVSSPAAITAYSRDIAVFTGGVTATLGDAPKLSFNSSKGTPAIPEAVELNNILGGINFNAFDGSTYQTKVFLGASIESSANGLEGFPGGFAVVLKGDATFIEFVFKSTGELQVPSLSATEFIKVAEVSGSLPSPAQAGMIVLDGGTFKGYNGSAWVTLG